MSSDLALLTGDAVARPSGAVGFHVGPNEALRDEAHSHFYAWVGERVDLIECLTSKLRGQKGTVCWTSCITPHEEVTVGDWELFQPEAAGWLQEWLNFFVSLLREGNFVVGKDNVDH